MKINKLVLNILILSVLLPAGCAYNDLPSAFDCANSDLAVSLSTKSDATSCKAIDGKISVAAAGGEGAYDFNINGGEYQTGTEFEKLAPGSYTVTVKDFNNCKKSVTVDIGSANSDLNATTAILENNQCATPNGSFTISASGGSSPYQYQIEGGGFSATNVFSGLKNGQYAVTVKDASDCQKVVSVTVPRGNFGISYSKDVEPIFEAKCNLSGCHDSSTGGRDWTNFANVKRQAGSIKVRTANRSMPIGGLTLTQQQINLIGCWVDDGAANN
jgi:SprB repeat